MADPAATGIGYHAKNLIQSTVGDHPTGFTVLLILLTIVIMYLIYRLSNCDTVTATIAATKSSFSNHPMPQWHHGGADAGHGGSLDRSTTHLQASAYLPHLRRGGCPAGSTPVSYYAADNSLQTHCVDIDPMACSRGWSPAATLEAAALGSVGSLVQDTYGEQKLQAAVNGHQLDDAQLEHLLQHGSAP